METLLPVINKLQDLMTILEQKLPTTLKPNLPQIIVVGAQSVGKSSLLEALVGRDFLPRGPGMVTKRPLVLQLRNPHSTLLQTQTQSSLPGFLEAPTPFYPHLDDTISLEMKVESRNVQDVSNVEEFGYFLHCPEKIFKDFDGIRREIHDETERLLGNTKTISTVPISLKIHSTRVIDLTLVDLPGIIKVPLADQPGNIEAQIQNLILSYISQPNSIILAVSAANIDLANSDALKLARKVDPTGQRTIGVLTKCDLIDRATSAADVLSGRLYPLKKGYAAVVCRSQQDFDNHIDIAASLKKEELFFDTHVSYREIRHRCGTRFLGLLLHQTLIQHIQKVLPEVQHKISVLIDIYQAKLSDYGNPLSATDTQDGALILNYLTIFSRTFQDMLNGRESTLDTSFQLVGGARLHYIFHDWLENFLKISDPLGELSNYEIRAIIRNATGAKGSLFIPEAAFELLVRREISKFRAPALHCVHLVYNELQRIILKCSGEKLHNFQTLKNHINRVAYSILSKCLEQTLQLVSNLFHIESAYINLNHPDFVSVLSAYATHQDFKEVFQFTQNSFYQLPGGGHSKKKKKSTPITALSSPVSITAKSNATLKSQESFILPASTQNLKHGSSIPTLFYKTFSFHHIRMACKPQYTPPLLQAPPLPDSSSAVLPGIFIDKNKDSSSQHNSTRFGTQPSTISQKEQVEVNLIRFLVKSYLEIVRKNIADYIPKTIMFSMVNLMRDTIHPSLVAQIYKPELFDTLMHEGEGIIRAREECSLIVRMLTCALHTLNHISHIEFLTEA